MKFRRQAQANAVFIPLAGEELLGQGWTVIRQLWLGPYQGDFTLEVFLAENLGSSKSSEAGT